MNQERKPILIVVAGPNGAGKATITDKLLRHEWMGGANTSILWENPGPKSLPGCVESVWGKADHWFPEV